MSLEKKLIRKNFRDICLKRDRFKCVTCGFKPNNIEQLDVHHITNPKLIFNGGYVAENGISLCPDCHIKAEQFHATGHAALGFSVDDLYKLINSNLEKAQSASLKTK